jgi:GDP-L-fucose synthase
MVELLKHFFIRETPNDNFDLETSHVLPALIRKFHEAKVSHQSSVVLWGTEEAL